MRTHCGYASHSHEEASSLRPLTSLTPPPPNPNNNTRQVGEARSDARWKHRRCSHAQFIERQRAAGIPISPLLSVPGVTTKVFRRDWLHCVDQGVAADYLGNLLKEFWDMMPGASKQIRLHNLWLIIKGRYDAHPEIPDRLPGLRKGGIQSKKKAPPKLKCSAAVARGLIPIALELAEEMLDPQDPKHLSMLSAAREMHACYECLREDLPYDWLPAFRSASSKFAQHMQALAQTSNGVRWRLKPKMHMFLELAFEGSKPNRSWTYRDEDNGGYVSKLSRIRGGWHKPKTYTSKVLYLFAVHNRIPRIV